ncbi:MAG: UDP binding domain-containing protein [Eubacteriaceae bacterium]|nr:UDP binding domain-containing protein [Eubacteriaceae bacterium]
MTKEKEQRKAGVIGLTVTGLAWGAVLAHQGVPVLATDMDEEVVVSCEEGEWPGQEPGLAQLAGRMIDDGDLELCANTRRVIRECPVIFVTCMVPPDANDRPGLRFVEAIVRLVAAQALENRVLVIKAAVSPGSTRQLQKIVDATLTEREDSAPAVQVLTMPEGFDDGRMLAAMEQDGALVLGCDGTIPEAVWEVVHQLPRWQNRLITCTTVEAEQAVFINSGLMAAEQSYLETVAGLCAGTGTRFDRISQILTKQKKIRHQLLAERGAGVGIGGARLPRERRELEVLLKENGQGAGEFAGITQNHPAACVQWLSEILKTFSSPTVAVLGLSPSPGTDDLRETPAVDILKQLAAPMAEAAPDGSGCFKLYVPWGMDQVKWRLYAVRDAFTFCPSPAAATRNADVLLILGRWPGGSGVLGSALKKRMTGRLIVDAAAMFDRTKAESLGFDYLTLLETR